MKKYFLIFLILFAFKCVAQNYKAPEYPEGKEAFKNYVLKYTNYPIELKMDNKEGNVTALIKIDNQGKTKVRVIGQEPLLKAEVLRVLSLMPKWRPAVLNGNPIDTIIKQEIYFSLNRARIKDSTVIELIEYMVALSSVPPLENGEMEKHELAIKNFNSAIELFKQEKYAEALVEFKKAKDNGLYSQDLFYSMGHTNYKLNNIEAACTDWVEAARIGDKDAKVLYEQKCK